MSVTAKYFVSNDGKYLGAWDGYVGPGDIFVPPEYPEDAIEVPYPPEDGRQIWLDGVWQPLIDQVPVSVTSRQFKMQLVLSGLKNAVDTWVSDQPEVVQVAYEYSGNFVRDEPMMQAGFTAMGFSQNELNDFFIAASKL